jgi:GDP-L-fucose synthase
MKDKKVLVAGGTGFIGLNIVKGLVERGFSDIVVTTHTEREYYYDLHNNENINLIKCDLTNKEECHSITKDVDILVLASAVSFGASFIQNNPLGLVNDNVIMNVNLLDGSYKNGVEKVIYFGSTTGYPDTEAIMREEDMFKGDPFDRYFSVGWMKRYTEVLMRLYSEKLNLMDCTVMRLSNVYGPYDKFDLETSHVLPAMVRKFCEKIFPLEIWGDGEDSRDLIYIDDIVEAVVKSFDCTGFNAYNVGYGSNYTVNDIVSMLCDIHEIKPEIVYVKNKPKMIKKRSVCVEKIKTDLGFAPSTTLESGLKLTTDWLNDNIQSIYR